MFTQLFSSIGELLAVGLPIWVIGRLIMRRRNPTSIGREIVLFVFSLYLLVVASMTVVPARWTTGTGQAFNLVPVVNLISEFTPPPGSPPEGVAVRNLLGNLGLLLPLGVFLPLLWRRFHGLRSVLLAGFLTAFFIEVSQFAMRSIGSYRTADIDDVLLNTLGAGIGYYIYKAATAVLSLRRPAPVVT